MNRTIILAATAVLLLTGCPRHDGPPESGGGDKEKFVIFTTFYPAQYFTQRIAGGLAKVVCPVPEDEDAIFWKPDAAALTGYQNADLIVLNGAGFAQWVSKVSLPESRIVDTAKPLAKEFIAYQDVVTHSHGPKGEHAHEGLDGHTWVDPVNALAQAEQILLALQKRLPEQKDAFQSGFDALADDLKALDARLKEYQAGYKNQPLLASHPAYNYIARRYGWNLKNLDLDPEEMPSDEAIAKIKELLVDHPAKFLIWEGEPKPEIAAKFKTETGLASIVFSPCELLSEDEKAMGIDYLKVMRENLENLGPAMAE